MYQGQKVILIVPFFNEEGRIGRVIKRAKQASFFDEICAVNDGSKDNGVKVAQGFGAVVLSHSRRTGVGAAIRTGIKYALNKKADIIVICAGNDKDDPGEADRLLKPIVEEGCQYVHGSRFLR